MQNVILVTGATGHVGRHVVSQLLHTGAPVRALVRNPDLAGLPSGVDVVRGDLSVPDTLDGSLNGVKAVFLVWPFLTAEGAPTVLEALRKHVRRIVYVSTMPVNYDFKGLIQPMTVWTDLEYLIEASGLEWTFLQCSGFATNTVRFWAPQIRGGGSAVRWPYGAAARSLIDERDIAAVAVRALTEDGHAGAKYVLTGPQSLTHSEQVQLIGEAIGRPLQYEEISPEAARQQMMTAGWPALLVDSALYHWSKLVTEPEPVTHTVEEVTGAPAHTFHEWASDHADDFRRPSAEEVAMTTDAVANEYVFLFRQGKVEEAIRLVSPDMVRVAPMETAGMPMELRGVEAIMENSRRLTDNYEIHNVEIAGPFVGEGRFAVRFAFDETFKPTGERTTTTKMSLYSVEEGKLVREEVYYYNVPPHP